MWSLLCRLLAYGSTPFRPASFPESIHAFASYRMWISFLIRCAFFFRFLLLLLRSRRFSIPLDEHMYESDEHCAAGRLKRWQQWTALSLTMISSRGQEKSQGNAIETGHRTVATEQVTSRDCTSLINKDPFDQRSALTRTYQQSSTTERRRQDHDDWSGRQPVFGLLALIPSPYFI